MDEIIEIRHFSIPAIVNEKILYHHMGLLMYVKNEVRHLLQYLCS